MKWKCKWFGHLYSYRLNRLNGCCIRCGWFEYGPNTKDTDHD
jgi:predicted  nucleic acid-binding Zn-ribbon protein